ncbi:MAG: DciA family protein [Casimicrobiaceae bacterium]
MARTVPTQSLSRVLAADTRIAAWFERSEREARVTAAVRRNLPRAFADRVRAAETTTQTLELAVSAGAISAVVRQRTPDLLASLRREGWDFTELRVRVQVSGAAVESVKINKIQRDKVDKAPLRQLAQSLPPGPLRTAVENLIRRGG